MVEIIHADFGKFVPLRPLGVYESIGPEDIRHRCNANQG